MKLRTWWLNKVRVKVMFSLSDFFAPLFLFARRNEGSDYAVEKLLRYSWEAIKHTRMQLFVAYKEIFSFRILNIAKVLG